MHARLLAFSLALLAGLLPAAGFGAQDPAADPARGLQSKEPARRLEAIEALASAGTLDPKLEKALAGLLDDDDWEVGLRAAQVLAAAGTRASAPALRKAALDAPARILRLAAAEALARVAPEEAWGELLGRVASKDAVRAWEALGAVAALAPAPAAVQGELEKALAKARKGGRKSEEIALRRLAARAYSGLPEAERPKALEIYLADEDLAVRAAALDAAAARPVVSELPKLLEALRQEKLDDTLERRLVRALTQACATATDGQALAPLEALLAAARSDKAPPGARVQRLATALVVPVATAGLAKEAMLAGLENPDVAVRSAAVHACGRAKLEPGLERLPELGRGDADARVRALALRTLLDARGGTDPKVRELALDRLTTDSSPFVREQAAVALCERDFPAAVPALEAALADASWEVAVCAAVSLGKTRAAEARPPLIALSRSPDWRLRGAAVVGLTHLLDPQTLSQFLGFLDDSEASIRRVALGFLERHTRAQPGTDAAAWRKWWEEHGSKVKLIDEEARRAARERYGYTVDDAQAFEGLDVVVLESRGDHIQELLTRLGIEHRLTAAARVASDGVPPAAVYVSNCTGEIEAGDIERLSWFVRTGGALFGSCWSLSQTLERAVPGFVRQLPTSEEVLDQVPAWPCDPASPFLKGVFPPGVRPLYHLEGAHLIDVLDRERCEVLIDSPECASRWGGGNLAVWFRAGHGLVLDSVNHFDLQGLEAAQGLKTDLDRKAYAVDHMGLALPDLRKVRGEGWWSSSAKAAVQVQDLSAFRFVANFVRWKRLRED